MLLADMLFQMANYVEWLCSSGAYHMNQCGEEMEVQLSKSQKSDSIGVTLCDTSQIYKIEKEFTIDKETISNAKTKQTTTNVTHL